MATSVIQRRVQLSRRPTALQHEKRRITDDGAGLVFCPAVSLGGARAALIAIALEAAAVLAGYGIFQLCRMLL